MLTDKKGESLSCTSLTTVNADTAHLNAIVEIHLTAFKGFFLESLGKRFLKVLYRGYIDDPSGICLVAINEMKVVGFVAGATVPEEFFRRLLRRQWPALVFTGASSMIFHPIRVGRKLFSALHYRGERPADMPNAALLSSIGVAPGWTGKGIGKMLLTAFYKKAKASGVSIVFLTTDRDKNNVVNKFYLTNGFYLHSTFQKERNRWMNLYSRSL